MAKTKLELVNKVLVRLREDTVTATNETDYSALVGEFVEEALSEVEDARDWNVLRTTISIDTTTDLFIYALSDVGDSYNILYVHENNNDYDLTPAPSSNWMTHQLLDDSLTSGEPRYYEVNGVSDLNNPVINIYPPPDSAGYSIQVALKVKTQLDTDDTSVLVPWLPVVLKAYELAIDERGDDAGDTLVAVRSRYDRALQDGVAYDAALSADEIIWFEE